MNTFITNAADKKLKDRLLELIQNSQGLKFLVGFFYFSGIRELYEGLKKQPDIQIDVLVGLNVDSGLHGLSEYADNQTELTEKERFERFLESVSSSINSDDFDTPEFYQQIHYFTNLITADKLRIRKTYRPNHAKLYIFKIKQELQSLKKSVFVTGSSNLTKAGLISQDEFNVEISDYGTEKAENYFDELWADADKITEYAEFKQRLLALIQQRTLVTEVTPFEAFALILKTYIDAQKHKNAPSLKELLIKKGYEPYAYQLDAVAQALAVIENYNGVIISDVVGLGKSVIAGMIAKSLGKRGIIICPPGLIGGNDKMSGWQKYKEDFELHDWEIRSLGLDTLEDTLKLVKKINDFEVIIVDEVHRFRNQDTRAYDLLEKICKDKISILLTATPFNNSPADIFSLLKLFVVPGKSRITLDNDLDAKFRVYEKTFEKLSFIKKNHQSIDKQKRDKAESYFESLFGKSGMDIAKVKQRSRYLSNNIRAVIEPVLIRRNRIDLKKDPLYSKEIANLPTVKDPQEVFFVLTKEQSAFYDEVINDYFGEEGRFNGAIYRPFVYELGLKAEKISGEEANFEYRSQTNLYDFMRRLIVKRFESSFGAFEQSVKNFREITIKVQKFIKKSGGKFILDRKLVEKIYTFDIDSIEESLKKYAEDMENGDFPKSHRIYDVGKFKEKQKFLDAIQADIDLFAEILARLEKLALTKHDPKLEALTETLKKITKGKDARKMVIFTEYADTALYLEKRLAHNFKDQLVMVCGQLSTTTLNTILKNFDASYEVQENKYQILLATDKISEGFNLNRAGAIINYDIPWNPTRVIQRVGRINRISKKLFDELYIYNFFPTEQGAPVVKSRQIACDKMFLIHNTLGEDAKIFEADEEPTAARLYAKIMENPEAHEEESFITAIRRRYYEIEKNYPEVISHITNLPLRVKTAKKGEYPNVAVFIRKGLGCYFRLMAADAKKPDEVLFQDIIRHIECKSAEPRLELSDTFWGNYLAIKEYKQKTHIPASENSLEKRALNNLRTMLTNQPPELAEFMPFIRSLREDIVEYKTLSDYTLRIISGFKTDSKEKKHLDKIHVELSKLRHELGENYLDKIKQKVGNISSEVIIAVENQTA